MRAKQLAEEDAKDYLRRLEEMRFQKEKIRKEAEEMEREHDNVRQELQFLRENAGDDSLETEIGSETRKGGLKYKKSPCDQQAPPKKHSRLLGEPETQSLTTRTRKKVYAKRTTRRSNRLLEEGNRKAPREDTNKPPLEDRKMPAKTSGGSTGTHASDEAQLPTVSK